MSRQEAALAKAVEPLQIPYPRNFSGEKTKPDATQLYISTEFAIFTVDELEVIGQFLTKLPYPQSLKLGASFLAEDDPLLSVDQDELDAIEAREGIPNSRTAPGGGERAARERVIILRESGYAGSGTKALLAGTQGA